MKKKLLGLVHIFLISLMMLDIVRASELPVKAEGGKMSESKVSDKVENTDAVREDETDIEKEREDAVKEDKKDKKADKADFIKEVREVKSVEETVAEKDVTKREKKNRKRTVKIKKKNRAKKSKSVKSSFKCTDKELKMLTCVIYLEAGNQPYKGKLAVGNVVMNRVKNKHFPNTITKVIYQSAVRNGRTYYQFSLCKPAGALDRAMAIYGKRTGLAAKYEKDCLKAAKAALKGHTAFDRKYHFFRIYSDSVKQWKPDGERIAATYFYNY